MRCLLVVAFPLILFASIAPHAAGKIQNHPQGVLALRERQIRERVKIEVLPIYPAEALKDKAKGIMVARIEFDAGGNVTNIEVVESAHPAFIASTARALKRWKFEPINTSKGEIFGGKGKLTFYFFYRTEEDGSNLPSSSSLKARRAARSRLAHHGHKDGAPLTCQT